MIAIVISIAVMFGWYFDVPILKSFLPNAATMKFNSALCLLLAGISLWLLQNENNRSTKKRIGQFLASLVVLIGILTLGEYLLRLDLGIDQIFIRDLGESPEGFPGRMSPIAAVCFTLSGLALILIDVKISQYFSISVILLSLLAVVGYLFEYHSLYQLGSSTSIALHTGIAFLILSIATLAARPSLGIMEIATSDTEGGRAIRLLLPYTTLFIILLGWSIDQGERLGFLNAQNSLVTLILLLVVTYSVLIYSYAGRINQAEEHIKHLNRLYATLSHMNQAVVHSRDRDTLFQTMCEVAVKVGQFRIGRIGLLNVETGIVSLIEMNGRTNGSDQSLKININNPPYNKGMIGSAIHDRKIVVSDDVQADERMKHWHEDSRRYGYHSAAAVPFYCRNEVIGILILYAAEVGFFKMEDELRLLKEISRDISFALDALENEKERRLAEEQFRLAIESAPNAIMLLNPAGQILLMNKRAEKYFGYTHNELVDGNVELLVPERFRDKHVDYRANILADPQARTMDERRELYGLHKNGSEFPIEIGLAPIETSIGTLVMATIVDITERKKAENALRESEEKYRSLFESIDQGFCTIEVLFDENEKPVDYRFLIVNPAFERQTGISNAVGRRMREIAPLHEEHWFQIYGKIAVMGEPLRFENPAEQLHRYYDVYAWKIGTTEERKVAILFNDITERKYAEAQIRRQLQHLNGLRTIDQAISSSFDIRTTLEVVLQQVGLQLSVDAAAILLINSENHTMEYAANRGFRRKILDHVQIKVGDGHASLALRERRTIHIPDFVQADSKLADDLQMAGEDFADYYGTPLIAKDKIEGVLEVYHRSPLNADSEWINMLVILAGQAAIAIDNALLWERVQRHTSELEQRVEERTTQLNQTNIELEHANRAKDEFLAAMSHELRTPLNSILGLSEVLLEQRRDPLSEHQKHSLQIIESSGRHLLELINDILDLSKIEAGKFDYYPQVVEVDKLCRSSLSFVKEQATRKSIKLTYKEEIPASKIYADSRRLKQILVNLLANAVKFSPNHGQVTLEVRAEADQDLVQFSVIDNGIGIAPEDLKRLFQPFVQVDSKLNRSFEGTGLGLALVQKLTELHGGSVEVESGVGKGSRFTINLPWGKELVDQQEKIESGDDFSSHDATGKADTLLEGAGNKKMVLLAEDNMANVLTIGEYLESHGFEVAVAHDGQEAIEQAMVSNPNIILMDIQMPVLDGLEAIRRLRAKPEFASVPIIALTALAMPGDRELCLEAGADEYVSKPVSLKNLAKTISRLLKL